MSRHNSDGWLRVVEPPADWHGREAWSVYLAAIPDPAVVLCLDGGFGLKFFDGKGTVKRGFATREAAGRAR